MSFLKGLFFLLALLVLVKSEFPVDIEDFALQNEDDSTVYRLPKDLDSVHYDVEITPYFQAEGQNEAFTFRGTVTITVKALEDSLNTFVIQENVRTIIGVSVLEEDTDRPVPLNRENPFERIRQYHFLKFNLRDGVTLTKDRLYKLRVVYIGNINETPLSRGIFRGSYKDSNGGVHWYAASHLQPTNSRQAFPSFDEPGFKATFNIIINRPAHFKPSFSNMRIRETIEWGNRVKEIFHTTPRMSAYLVTVHISEDFQVIADNNDENRSFRVIARPGTAGQGDYALEIGPQITEWLEHYYNITYYTEHGMKNDQIAVPDWASGATENWGLVSYRELRLLYQEGETNAVDKMSIGTIIAHELAHKWFGNLITCQWWDNVWINEGFASYFEYFAMDGVDTSLELEDQFIIMYLQSSLSADSSAGTRALQHTVNSPSEVTGHFSGISYSKGASLLLMLKHWLSENIFRRALHLFLDEMSYEHAVPDDLYRSFDRAVSESNVTLDVDIQDVMRYWVNEPGSPILHVSVDMTTGTLHLRQERFFISASASQTEQVWPIPLTYTTGNNPNWDDVTPSAVMTDRTMTLRKQPGHEWVIFNVQQKDLYRVNYDTHNWEMIAATLLQEPNRIHKLNRAQIVDDIFALMRSERVSYSLGFKVLEFLKSETSYYSWYPAISGFNWLRNRLLHLPQQLQEFDSILYEYLGTVINSLGYTVVANETVIDTLNRFYLLNFACNIGHEGCVTESVRQFALLSQQGVDPNLRRHVFCQGLLAGDENTWQAMYNRRQDSNNQADEAVMLRALGCTVNNQARQNYLEMILSDDVKAQDSVNAFTFFYMGHRSNANVALQFIKQRTDDVRRKVVLPAWFNSILSNLASHLDEPGLQDMEQWLQENQSSVPEYAVGLSAIALARSNMLWGTQKAEEILAAARNVDKKTCCCLNKPPFKLI